MWSAKLTKHEKSTEEDAKLSHELPCLNVNSDASEDSKYALGNDIEVGNMKDLLEDDEEQNMFEKNKDVLHFCVENYDHAQEDCNKEKGPDSTTKSSGADFSHTSVLQDDIGYSNPNLKTTVQQKKSISTRHLPQWIWRTIECVLGVSKNSGEKPWLATTIHILTFGSALVYIISYSWFVVYDISSLQTKRDALNGIVSMVIATFWSFLAVYANNLAYNMFSHKVFVKNVKLHSRSVIKCYGAVTLIICGVLFITLSDYAALEEFKNQSCEFIELESIVCEIVLISRIVFSAFAFSWNILISLLLLAVCRTHAISIRQFINQLFKDAVYYDQKYGQKYGIKSSFLFDNTTVRDYIISFQNRRGYSLFENDEIDTDDVENVKKGTFSSVGSTTSLETASASSPDQKEMPANEEKAAARLESKDMTLIDIQPSESATELGKNVKNVYLTQSEILHHYWKLQCQIWMSSSMLQRWMVCFICLCVIWIGVTLVHWLSHSPTLLDVILFIIPLIMLPILCSSYAEVNNEGQRMIKSISPCEDRLWMLFYLHQAPLQMTIYGYPIKYSTVVTTVFGLVAALTSGIVLQEIKQL